MASLSSSDDGASGNYPGARVEPNRTEAAPAALFEGLLPICGLLFHWPWEWDRYAPVSGIPVFQPEPRFTTPMRPIVLGNSAILASATTILCFSAPPLRACGWSRPGREALFTGNGLVD